METHTGRVLKITEDRLQFSLLVGCFIIRRVTKFILKPGIDFGAGTGVKQYDRNLVLCTVL